MLSLLLDWEGLKTELKKEGMGHPEGVKVQCFQLSDIIILVWACRKEMSHQTL